ncbi:MAG: DUF2927 domain-containing protein [Elainellaceae cyanobacterium]
MSTLNRRAQILLDRCFLLLTLLGATIFCLSTSGVERSPKQNHRASGGLSSPLPTLEHPRQLGLDTPGELSNLNQEEGAIAPPQQSFEYGAPEPSQYDSFNASESADAHDDITNNDITSNEAIAYFLDIALGTEYGNADPVIRKWQGDINIQVNGSPTFEDEQTLQAVIAELQQLTGLTITLTSADPNMTLYFVPESEFSDYDPNYIPINLGFAWIGWNSHDVIHQARILITTEEISQTERNHLIREEVTQAISGCMKDSDDYADSIFYQAWTQTTEFSSLDRDVIRLMYRPDIQPGMDRDQVLSAFGVSD